MKTVESATLSTGDDGRLVMNLKINNHDNCGMVYPALSEYASQLRNATYLEYIHDD